MKETQHYIEISLTCGNQLKKIREEYCKLLRHETCDGGMADLAEIFQWAKLKEYKFITQIDNTLIFYKEMFTSVFTL